MLKHYPTIVFASLIVSSFIFCQHAQAFPIKVIGNGIFLPCSIGEQVGFCKLDTGATKNILFPKVQATGKMTKEYCYSGDQSKVVCSSGLIIEKLIFKDTSFENVEFVKSKDDIYSFLKFRVLGIIGMEMFVKNIIHLDLRKKKCVITNNIDEVEIKNAFPFEYHHKRIFLKGTFGNESADLFYDLGASMSVVNKRFFDAHKDWFNFQRNQSAVDATGVKNKLPIYSFKNTSLSYAGVDQNNGKMLVIDLSYVEKSIGHPIDILLGFDLAKNKNVTIDFINRTIQIGE